MKRANFRDMKNLIDLEKLTNKRREQTEKMVALLLLAYAIGLWLGETLRMAIFPENSCKHKLYSGLFILLKLKLPLSKREFLHHSALALSSFASLVYCVQTNA